MLAKRMIRKSFSALLAAALLAACSAVPSASGSDQPAPDGGTASAPAGGALRALESGTQRGRYAVAYRDNTYDHPFLTWVDYESLQVVPLCAAPNCAHDSDSCTAWAPDGSTVAVWAIDEETMLKQVDVYGGANGDTHTVTRCHADGSDPVVLFSGAGDSLRMNPRFTDGENLWYIGVGTDGNGTLTGMLYRQPLAGGELQPIGPAGFSGIVGCDGRNLVYFGLDYSPLEAIPEPDWSTAHTEAEIARLETEYQAAQSAVRLPASLTLLNADSGERSTVWIGTESYEDSPSRIWANGALYTLGGGRQARLHWQRLDGSTGEMDFSWPVAAEGEFIPDGIVAVVDGRVIAEAEWASEAALAGTRELTSDSYKRIRLALDPAAGTATELTLGYSDPELLLQVPLPILGQTEDDVLVQFEKQTPANADGWPVTRCGLLSCEDFFASRPNYREIVLPYGPLPY